MANGTVVVWGPNVFVLAEDESEARKMFKKQNKQKVEAVDILEEVEGVIEAKPSKSSGSSTDSTTRIISSSGSGSGSGSSSSSSSSSSSKVTGSKSKSKSTGSRPSVPSTQVPAETKGHSTIVVLTYNVLYEIGDPTKCIKPCEHEACVQNVCMFIDKEAKDCDFIGIQEYIHIDKLTKYSRKLRIMGHSHTEYKGNLAHLLRYGPITFYDKDKYKPDEECSHMKTGFMKRLGRGIQINFFSKWLCVINVHAGHKRNGNGIDTFERSLNEYLNGNYCSADCKQKFIRKLKEYEIIMLGDMNDEMVNDFSFKVDGTERRLVGRTTERTCCGDKQKLDGNNKSMGAYDHILSTFSDPQKTKTQVHTGLKHHSDHSPVKSKIVA